MTDSTVAFATPEELISQLRNGRMVLMLIDNTEGSGSGVVMMAAESCESEHVTFMARRARGLVCLALTEARCQQLNLPLMVEGNTDSAPFTLSIEAASGIETGISAADRARTIRVAVDPSSVAADLVQPGHIFPVAAAEGGVLNRVDAAGAGTDITAMAGLLPAAVFTEVLNSQGNVANESDLMSFASEHGLSVGRVSDLVNFRLAQQKTIDCVREGDIETRFGPMQMRVYRDQSQGRLHLALVKGNPQPDVPTLVRVHVTSTFRDLVGTTLAGQPSWRFDSSLNAIAESEVGALVLISRPETADELLASVDRLLDTSYAEPTAVQDGYALVGLGAQILRDLNVGQVRLLGAPVKYNALSGFGLEVCEFVAPQ